MSRVVKVNGKSKDLHLILDDSEEHTVSPECPCKPFVGKRVIKDGQDAKIYTHRWKDL